MLRRLLIMALLSAPVIGHAQSALDGVDLSSPAMTEAEMTRADVSGARFHNADVTSTRLMQIQGEDEKTFHTVKNLSRAVR
ncbi:MAG: pentapeptide repeat-containing protein [Pseudomonadota bacterium]